MSERKITKGRRQVQFPALPVLDVTSAPVPVAPLTARLVFSEGRSLFVDLRDEPCGQLAGELLHALTRLSRLPNRINSPGTAQRYCTSIRQLVRFLGALRPDPHTIQVSDLTAHDLALFEDHLRAAMESERNATTPYKAMGMIVRLLRWWRDTHPDRIAPALVDRLRYVADGTVGADSPRDAYSPKVAASLRKACIDDISRTVDRLRQGEARLLAGRDPQRFGWKEPDNVLWAIAHAPRGVIHNKPDHIDTTAHPELSRLRLTDLHLMLYSSSRDLVPFIVLLALTTDIAVESLKELKAACLKNADGRGTVEVEYLKRRAKGDEWKRARVRNDTLWSPGRVISTVRQLTQRARDHLGTDSLWAAYTLGRLHVARFTPGSFAGAKHDPVARFVADHDLRDEDGAPLRLQLSRLRKTRREDRYRATNGQLEPFAEGVHSVRVAGDHYGDIPASRHIHEASAEAGILQAFEQATARLVPPEEEALFRQRPELVADLVGIPVGQVDSFLSGESDLWLCKCKDIQNSPHAPPGVTCPRVFWGCLDCPNAVITAGNLPAIISFLNFMVGQRDVLAEREWAAKFGRPYGRIVGQILPAFPGATVNLAWTVAADGEDLRFLPPDILLMRYAE